MTKVSASAARKESNARKILGFGISVVMIGTSRVCGRFQERGNAQSAFMGQKGSVRAGEAGR